MLDETKYLLRFSPTTTTTTTTTAFTPRRLFKKFLDLPVDSLRLRAQNKLNQLTKFV